MAQTYPTNNVKQNFGCQQSARELESWKRTVSDKREILFSRYFGANGQCDFRLVKLPVLSSDQPEG